MSFQRSSVQFLLLFTVIAGSHKYLHAQNNAVAKTQINNQQLWLKQPAKVWLEALPLGNGTLGAMVYGGTETDRVQFNENSLVTGTTDMVGFYQPFGNLYIKTGHQEVSNYKRSLDLNDAVHTISYQHKGIGFKREYFVSYPDQLIVMMITSDKKASVNVEISLKDARKKTVSMLSNTIEFNGKLEENGMEYASMARVANRGGKLDQSDSTLLVANADTAFIYLSAVTSFKRFNVRDVWGELPLQKLHAGLESASRKTYTQLRSRHTNDFGNLFNRVNLQIGQPVDLPTDERLRIYNMDKSDLGMEALLFQYGRYLLISSSRRGGLPANLQGLWNNEVKPAWYSQYTTNINIQMNYWLAEQTNLTEVHDPMLDWVENLGKVQKTSTDSMLKTHAGWVAYSTNNIMGGSSKWRLHRPGSAWMSRHFWERFNFTQDTVFLRNRTYPFLKEIVQYWEGHLVENKDGRLITPDGWSPEHGPGKNEGDKNPYPGASYDQQIIYDLFSNYIAAAKVLNKDKAYRIKVEAMQNKLLKPQVGRWGQLQEWMEDWDDSTDHHRHNSHMFAVHPGTQIDPRTTPEWAAAARRSLIARGNISTGWSSAWKMNIWARLREGDKAHEFIRELLKPVTPGAQAGERSGVYPNLFGCHPPFQMDANFGYTAGVAEMLLQSHNGVIQLLPALPTAWDKGTVSGLKARGNLVVGITWESNKLQRAELKAGTSGQFDVHYNGMSKKVKLLAGKKYVVDANLNIIK
jgi:alpha-L-fucosidase 2